MAHGTPDWGQTAGTVTTYQLTDLAELAVRLGSVVSFDRRGDVIWLEDFENGIDKWAESTHGDGAGVGLSDDTARNGKYSACLTAGSNLARDAEITKALPFPALSVFGIEFSFHLDSTIDNLQLELVVADGAWGVSAAVRWVDADNELQYQDSGGHWRAIATGIDLAKTAGLFHTGKLVFDYLNQKYVRVILNEHEYSLAGIAASAGVSYEPSEMTILITLTGRAANNDQVHVDDVIVTQNEPA